MPLPKSHSLRDRQRCNPENISSNDPDKIITRRIKPNVDKLNVVKIATKKLNALSTERRRHSSKNIVLKSRTTRSKSFNVDIKQPESQKRKLSDLLLPIKKYLTSKTADKKLRSIPVVFISSSFRNKAEIEMKLRKAPKPSEKQQASDSDSEDTTTEEEESQSSSDESEEELFNPSSSRTYPLRKKSPLVERRRTPTRAQSAGSASASDSSSESLIDIPPPTSGFNQKLFVNSSSKEKEKEKFSKSPKRNEDVPTKPGERVRALRSSSTDGHTFSQESVLYLRSSGGTPTSASKTRSFNKTFVPSKEDVNQRKSPEKEKFKSETRQSPSKSLTSCSKDKTDAEKSYSFRHLETKKTPTTDHNNTKAKQQVSSFGGSNSKELLLPPAAEPLLRRKPGRPRKIIPVPIVKTREEIEADSIPPAKRTRRAASNEFTGNSRIQQQRKEKPKESESEKEKRNLHLKRLHDPAKQQRDAIALRARQSKIMAKSRVLQSNKHSYNASWRKPYSDKKNEESLPSLNCEDSSSDIIRSDLIKENHSKSTTSSSGGGFSSSSNPVASTSKALSLFIKPHVKGLPVAKCDICNLTFTRKFSYTKHLATLQHQRMLRKCGAKDPKKQDEISSISKGRGRRSLKSNTIPLEVNKRKSLKQSSSVDALNRNQIEILPLEDEMEYVEIEDDLEEEDEEEEEEEEEDDDIPPYLSGQILGHKKYMCDNCGEIFNKKLEFTTHVWKHRENSDLKCPDCGIQFTDHDHSAFNEHIDSAHLKDVKLACEFCPSKFNREDYFEQHMQSHKRDMDEKFICCACDKRFSSHDLLSRHFDIKHLELGTPKVELSYDSYAYTTQFPPPPDFADCDNYFENFDPESEEIEGNNVILPDIEEDEDEEEEEEEEEEGTEEYPQTSHRNNSFLRNGQNPNNVVRRFLHHSWLNDNSIIGCGTVTPARTSSHFPYNPLSCKDCGKLFESRRLLVKHVEYFSHADRYVCNVCKKKFKWRYLLNRHMTRHTRGKEQLKLVAKAKRLQKPSFLLNRQKPMSLSSKMLPIPNKTSNSVSSARLQFPTNPILDGPSTSPSFSGKPLPSLKSKPKDSSVPIVISPISTSQFPTLNTKYPSTASTSVNSSFDDHHHSTSAASLIGQDPLADNDQEETYVTCDLCMKSFTDEKTLSVHNWFHQSDTLFSCPDCEAKCERKGDFELHYKCHETHQPFFLCYVCFKPFRWKKDMVRHIRKKHPDEKTYRCIYCNQRFKVNDELNVHISESHAKHRSFPCDYCGRRYAQKRYLLLHIRTQHGIESGSTSLTEQVNQEQFMEDESGEAESEIYLDASNFLLAEQHL